MKASLKPRMQWPVVIAGLVLLSAAGLAWLWFANMEQRWSARVEVSEAARRDQMLATTLLLRQNGQQVALAGSLAELSLASLPDGTVLAGEGLGVLSPPKAAQLLAWIKRGNVVITQPRFLQRDESSADSADTKPHRATADGVEVDPLAALLGVRKDYLKTRPLCADVSDPVPEENCHEAKMAAPLAYLTLPGQSHRLELAPDHARLVALAGAAAPILQDEAGLAVRVYRLGRGQVVMLSRNFFVNAELNSYDHGELLLALAKLHPTSKAFTIVKHFDAVPWYLELWRYASPMLVSVVLTMALLLWKALRRFGPLLPRPEQARRSLVEHIDATGAWLWKADGGRALLLDAAREDTLALIRRRAPALLRGAPAAINSAMAKAHSMSDATIDAALHQPAAPQPHQFARQIRTLQKMRKHYERH